MKIQMTTDISFCEQRRLTQLYNIPLARFTPVNPYSSGYTKFQLDMRRKTEILKYSPNKSSTQTNNLTKKERFALLSRGGKNSLSPESINSCESLPTPTSSSNVPGPIMLLKYDTNIPLYNYSDFNTRSYPDFVPTDETPWQFISMQNELIYDNGTSSIYYLIINNYVDQPRYNYTIIVPTGFSIGGTIPNSYVPPIDFSGGIMQLNVTEATLSVYYSDNLVTTSSATSLENAKMKIIVPVNNGTRPFNAMRFIGNLQFNNIQLYTAPTYVYKFSLTVNITITPTTNVVSYLAVIANMTSSGSSSTGCIILDSLTSDINSGSSISGI
jgi:hypothetical protein